MLVVGENLAYIDVSHGRLLTILDYQIHTRQGEKGRWIPMMSKNIMDP